MQPEHPLIFAVLLFFALAFYLIRQDRKKRFEEMQASQGHTIKDSNAYRAGREWCKDRLRVVSVTQTRKDIDLLGLDTLEDYSFTAGALDVLKNLPEDFKAAA